MSQSLSTSFEAVRDFASLDAARLPSVSDPNARWSGAGRLVGLTLELSAGAVGLR
ncbi:MAG: hypothetical protein ABI612_00070 [Betaproteobacteria bacterium]